MNKARRARINDIISKLNDLKEQLQDISDEEDEYADNMPENLQNSDRYDDAKEAVDVLYNCGETLEEVASQLEEIV